MLLEDCLYSRAEFALKDDDDFTWSSQKTIPLETLRDGNNELIGYRFNSENWTLVDAEEVDIDQIYSKFLENNQVISFLESAGIEFSVAKEMLTACQDLELAGMSIDAELIEPDGIVTDEFNGSFFVMVSSDRADFEIEGDTVMMNQEVATDDFLFETFGDSLKESTYIVVKL